MTNDVTASARVANPCTCYHAPEQHGRNGCGVTNLMGGPCQCSYDGSPPPEPPAPRRLPLLETSQPVAHLPTFSRLPIAKQCVFPWTAHAPKKPENEPPSPYRAMGNAVSRVAEVLALWGEAPVAEIAEAEGLTPSETDSLEQMAVHIRAFIHEHDDDQWRAAEQALAYDLRTGAARELKQAHPRDYSDRRPGEESGTPDLVHVTKDGMLLVDDYKTGRYQWGADPGRSEQMRALAIAASRAYGHYEVTVRFIQVDEDGLRIKHKKLDAFDLAVCSKELHDIYERIAGPPEPPRPGHWCTTSYCPIRSVCPATQAALDAIDRAVALQHPIATADRHGLTVDIRSAEHASYTLARLNAVEEAVAQIREAVKDFVRRNGPIPIDKGKLWGAIQCDGREKIDLATAGAYAAIERHLGAEVAASAVKSKTSKTALGAAAKAAQQARGEGVKKVRALLDELREIGAVKVGAPFEKFEAFLPRAD